MASPTATTNAASTRPVGAYRLTIYGVSAVILASIGNVLVLLIGLELAQFPSEFVGGSFGPLALGPVVVNSTVAAVGGTLAYGAITRYAARPNRTFTIIAGVVLVLSFAMFLAPDLAEAPPRVFAILGIMHVIAAAIIVGVLTRAATPEETSE